MAVRIAGRARRLARRREIGLLAALLATLAGPFLLRPRDSTAPAVFDRRLVILSPHPETVRQEIGRAFAQHWKERAGETLYLDWRIPGGSSEISLFLKSEFSSAFRYEWERSWRQPWSHEVATSFADPRLSAAPEARRRFLDSNVGIGVDLLFGGGSYDFQQHAEAGFLVAQTGDGQFGPGAVMRQHPDWFADQVIPEKVGGEPFRDPQGRWVGVVLARFGIVYNRDVLHRLGFATMPKQWADLGDVRLAHQLALADPTQSGSLAKAFELVIQQQMRSAVSRLEAGPDSSRLSEDLEQRAVREGWDAGLRLIQRISANARYFTDSASKIPLEVARGDAAAGMVIDAYGRAMEEFVRRPDGVSRVGFIAPEGGTSLSVDPIAMLRGAPDPALATAFIEFVLSSEGQKLWAFRAGTPGGPLVKTLRRLPVRRDFYTAANRVGMADADERPYAKADSFVYRPEWTGPVVPAIRFLIRVMCVDNHQELRQAWDALRRNGFPPAALATFERLAGASYDDARRTISPVLRVKDKVQEVRLARRLSDVFRRQYREAARLARSGGHAGE